VGSLQWAVCSLQQKLWSAANCQLAAANFIAVDSLQWAVCSLERCQLITDACQLG